MALNDTNKFKGITAWHKDTLTPNVLFGVIDFFRWASLGIGAYDNITQEPPTSGVFGGDRFQLKLDRDPRNIDGEIWRGFKSDWVWESGVDFSAGDNPIVASGVYVDDIFYSTATTSGAFAHYIDYPRGRVVFDTAISTDSTVKANFSTRSIQIVEAEEEGIRKLIHATDRTDRSDFIAITGGGNWSGDLDQQYQLPVLAVEIVSNSFTPYELGGGQLAHSDLIFYILASNSDDRDQIKDIVAYQSEKSIWLANRSLMKASSDFNGGQVDLDFRGMTVDNYLTYPTTVLPSGDGGFRWRECRFDTVDVESIDRVNNELFRAVIRISTTLVLNEI